MYSCRSKYIQIEVIKCKCLVKALRALMDLRLNRTELEKKKIMEPISSIME